jgi:hypothetical protein
MTIAIAITIILMDDVRGINYLKDYDYEKKSMDSFTDDNSSDGLRRARDKKTSGRNG